MKDSLIKVFNACIVILLAISVVNAQSTDTNNSVTVNWKNVTTVSKTTPTLQVVVNPALRPGGKLSRPAFAALHSLGADYVRYVPWLPYPRQAVAELKEPSEGKTYWDFSQIDPTMEAFMKAIKGHSVLINFSTLPAWMYKTDKPVTYPEDSNQVFWGYTQGTELRDPTMKEAAQYLARILSWYTRGGFIDEYGKRWISGHHYKISYWEVLNEIEAEHQWTPENYTKFYDQVVLEMRKVDPHIQFVGLALIAAGSHPEMLSYFLDPKHHQPGIPLDFISYHFYAHDVAGGIDKWQYSFFDQADAFLKTVRSTEVIRKQLSPTTKTDLNEIGVILSEDGREIGQPGYVAADEPAGYWNLNGAMFAYLYIKLNAMGIDVLGESQLVGYKSQYPSVSMVNYNTGEPNPRYWVLKLLKDNFKSGDCLLETTFPEADTIAQAFQTKSGRKLLIVNKRLAPRQVTLPAEFVGAHVSYVSPATGERGIADATLKEAAIELQANEVAVITVK